MFTVTVQWVIFQKTTEKLSNFSKTVTVCLELYVSYLQMQDLPKKIDK